MRPARNINKLGRRLMATVRAKDAIKPFHKVATTGSCSIKYLKKGTSCNDVAAVAWP